MAKMLAVELGPHNIRVNVVSPGPTKTELRANTQWKNLDRIRFPVQYPKGNIPLDGGKPATAEQVAQLVLFLASDAASHITGTEVWIDGAYSLITMLLSLLELLIGGTIAPLEEQIDGKEKRPEAQANCPISSPPNNQKALAE